MAKILPACTFVIPCLNEARSLSDVLRKIECVRDRFADLEIVLVDNGSDDNSVELARAFNLKLLHASIRGYGETLRMGIKAARYELVVIADADGTYDWQEAPDLVRHLLESPADLVVGNRLRGRMSAGAMPWMHRWIGTPFLSTLITFFYGRARGMRVGDCNGGFRVFRKSAYERWNVRARGMEFASEMIIRALQTGSHYVEVPISYGCAPADRRSNLRSVRDGLRHLSLILFSRSEVLDPGIDS